MTSKILKTKEEIVLSEDGKIRTALIIDDDKDVNFVKKYKEGDDLMKFLRNGNCTHLAAFGFLCGVTFRWVNSYNIINISVAKAAEALKISESLVYKYLNILIKKKYLRRLAPNQYFVNPQFCTSLRPAYISTIKKCWRKNKITAVDIVDMVQKQREQNAKTRAWRRTIVKSEFAKELKKAYWRRENK
ncbi:hypothetical protein [Aminiphilus sp.]|uniref:hypothetical protein n=1 Tax=Aminiphilus sp. TaxID=1872488 RepID=UPI00262487AE|nr:hypothetical protein [Aminiphilus sp.]